MTREGAVAQALAEAERDPTAAEQAVIGLTTLGNMFMELYADCAGYPVDSVIRDAAALCMGDLQLTHINLLLPNDGYVSVANQAALLGGHARELHP